MAGRTIGYARTGNTEQDISAQVEALRAAGCSDVYQDKASSGASLDRAGLQQVLGILESGDILKVKNLDRIARSVGVFGAFRKRLGARKIHIVILDAGIETTPALAEAAMKLMAATADSQVH